jgi:hypothetical protein
MTGYLIESAASHPGHIVECPPHEKTYTRQARECGHRKSIHNVDLAAGTGARQIASRTHYFYQIVESCLQLRIFASLVTNAIPSASAVAPIRRSHGSLE